MSARIARGAVLYVSLPRQDPLAGESGSGLSRRADGELLAGVGGGGACWRCSPPGPCGGRGAGSGGWPWAGSGIWAHWCRRSVWSRWVWEVMADRFLYLPQIGVCLVLVWGAGTCRRHFGAYQSLAVGSRLAAGRGRADGLRLATDFVLAEQRDGYGPVPWLALRTMPLPTTTWASPWPNRGQVDEAIYHYRKALEIKPDNVRGPQRSGPRLGRPRTGRRGHRALPQGPGD